MVVKIGGARELPGPEIHDDFRSKSNGPLAVADSGQAYLLDVRQTGGASLVGATPCILDGAGIGPPSGYSVSGPGGSTIAVYSFLQASGPISWIGGMLRWDQSDTIGASVCLAVTSAAPYNDVSPPAAPMHFGFTPYGLTYQCFSNGVGDLVQLFPDGYDSTGATDGYVRLPTPMACDNTSTYRVDCVIDRQYGIAYLRIGDNPAQVFRHPFIKLAGTYAMWEGYAPVGTNNFPRFTQLWADPDTAQTHGAQSHMLASLLGSRSAGGGAGPPGNRPSSRLRAGHGWYETGAATTLSAATAVSATTFTAPIPIPVNARVWIDSGTVEKRELRTITGLSGTGPYTMTVAALSIAHALGAAVTSSIRPTFSDGNFWRDTEGVIVGNRIPAIAALAAENATGNLGLNSGTGAPTVTRTRAPSTAWRVPHVYRTVATATGTCSSYFATQPVEAGTPIFAGIAQIMGIGTGRSASVTVTFYNSAWGIVGSVLTSTTTTLSTSTLSSILTPVGIVPATATNALVGVQITGAAVGNGFMCVDPTLALGPIPTHVRT